MVFVTTSTYKRELEVNGLNLFWLPMTRGSKAYDTRMRLVLFEQGIGRRFTQINADCDQRLSA